MKKNHWLVASLIFSAFLGGLVLLWPPVFGRSEPGCTFTALDIGQGDAILLQTNDGQDVLIDGGPSAAVVAKVGRYLRPGDRTIELVVSTHPDADHLTGLVDIINRYKVLSVVVSDIHGTTQTFQRWQAALKNHHLQPHGVVTGDQLSLGSTLRLQVIWPRSGYTEGRVTPTNEMSVGLRAFCVGSTALMIGDASSVVEDQIAESGIDIQAGLLKVSHHGSKYSSSDIWLRAVHPSIAIISVGIRNRYNHPHPSTLWRLERLGIKVYRTDQEGDIRFRTDGVGGWRKTP